MFDFDRIMGVFKLDANTFEAIEHDQNATVQAAVVVTIIALISGIGQVIGNIISGASVVAIIGGFIGAILTAFIGWAVWSGVVYLVGTNLFQGEADYGEMLRVIGYAYAPQVLGIIPCLGVIVGLVWTLAASFIAIRQGLDLDNTKTAITVVIAFVVTLIIYFVIGLIIGVVFGGAAALGGALSQ